MSEQVSAHEILADALRMYIETVRKTSHRVVSAGVMRRGATKGGEVGGSPKDEDDAEAVHDFRVALRRLRTALRPAGKIYGKKRLRAIEEDLKRFADVTSALRDEEVLRETLTSLDLPLAMREAVRAWIARRARQERARRTDVVRLLREDAEAKGKDKGAAPTLEDCVQRLEKRLHRAKSEISAADLGRKALERVRTKIRELAEVASDDVAGMHALRIRFKRLRYIAELFGKALGDDAAQTAKDAARLQSRLGDLHDLDEATVRMARAWGLAAEPRRAVLDALQSARARAAERSKKELSTTKRSWATELVEGPY